MAIVILPATKVIQPITKLGNLPYACLQNSYTPPAVGNMLLNSAKHMAMYMEMQEIMSQDPDGELT